MESISGGIAFGIGSLCAQSKFEPLEFDEDSVSETLRGPRGSTEGASELSAPRGWVWSGLQFTLGWLWHLVLKPGSCV